ncbi:alpha-L-iduronidase-like [Clavelina lepadiformis]|uniref:alpha-L-iduronidase-like n=1 Tax=Clavelina lepadiformis TaxID=159417 RepID=UPI00404124BA
MQISGVHMTCFLCLLLNVNVVSLVDAEIRYFDVFTKQQTGILNHFWESTGLCPPLPHSNAAKYFLSDDIKQNFLLIASVPHNGIKQIRMHWLLELINKKGVDYDFSNLDKLLQLLEANQLKPGFELMGNPSGYFKNFDNMNEIVEFKKLVEALAKRYINMFGEYYVSTWNFETWNEPDNHDFDSLKISTEGFLKYYDACSEGLRESSKALIFGGPGGSCRVKKRDKICWALFHHCLNGTNYITGAKGSRIDYIAIHEKGRGQSQTIINDELETLSQIENDVKLLMSTPLYNDEADPLVGWSHPQWWRSDVTYAAIIVKIISQHQHQIIANKSRSYMQYSLLSNDNAFLNYYPHFFTQRTLNARFQMNLTNPKYVHFVRKPVLTVMGLLSKLGHVHLNMSDPGDTIGGISSFCSPPACLSLEMSTILYNSVDTQPTTGKSIVQLRYHDILNASIVQDINGRRAVLNNVLGVTCSMDNMYTNPYWHWWNSGSPSFPTTELFKLLHKNEGPVCTDPTEPYFNEDGLLITNLTLPLPGVALHHICWKPDRNLFEPTKLQVHNITSGQVLITWQDSYIRSKCIKTYVVEFAGASHPDNFVTINNYKVIFNSFVFINEIEGVHGQYRVRAQDFWDRYGVVSNTFTYGI